MSYGLLLYSTRLLVTKITKKLLKGVGGVGRSMYLVDGSIAL